MAFIIGNFSDSLYPLRTKTELANDNAPVYGVKWDSWPGTPERLYDAIGMEVEPSTDTVKGRDDFEDVAPFNVKECITQYSPSLGKREILAYKGDADWDRLVASQIGDRMIEFPLFWYKRLGTVHMLISPEAKEGFKPCPAHFRDGILYDKIRISKFVVPETGADMGVSNTIVYPFPVSTATETMYDDLRTAVRAKGAYLFDLDCLTMLLWLTLIKHAAYSGFPTTTSTTTAMQNGGTEDVLGVYGSANDSSVLFGLENFAGKFAEYVDGMYLHYTGTAWPSTYTGYNVENKDVLGITKFSDVYSDSDVLWAGGVNSGSYASYMFMNQIPNNDWLLLCTQSGSAFMGQFMYFPWRAGSGSPVCLLTQGPNLFGVADSSYAHSAPRFFEFG